MRSRTLCIVSLLTLLAACSTYSGSGSGSNSSRTVSGPVAAAGASTRVSGTVSAGPVSVTLSAEQTATVRAWYGQSVSGNGNGNGRGRNGGLPPGIARNLERGKPLPPGIAKQYLPQNVLVQLPSPGTGIEYIVVAGKLLLVEAATQMVRQILLDSLFA